MTFFPMPAYVSLKRLTTELILIHTRYAIFEMYLVVNPSSQNEMYLHDSSVSYAIYKPSCWLLLFFISL